MCQIAPLESQLDYDNSGLQVGRLSAQVNRALLALDITGQVIDEAIELGAELVISHHPLIWGGLNNIDGDGKGAKALRLAENKITAISMHTNLDIALGGVNDLLMERLGASVDAALDEDGCGRVGRLPAPMALGDFLALCRHKLNAPGLRYYDAGRAVERLAVMGGAGGHAVETAYKKGCDTYLTGDIKYHQFLLGAELGMNIIDAGHFPTENPLIPDLAQTLGRAFPELEFIVSQRHSELTAFA